MTIPIRTARFRPQWQSRFQQSITYLLPAVIALIALCTRLDTYPAVWFDEGYKANAARTLAERGVYGTYTSAGYIPFDPGISSGPADVIPVALAFKLLGAGLAQARLVSVLFTLLAVVSLTGIAVELYGRRAALVISLFILAVPDIEGVSLLLIGRQILGEPAAVALTAAGLLIWFQGGERPSWRRAALAGVIIGIGLLSKMQIAIALLPAVVLVSLARWRRHWKILAQQFLLPFLSILVFAGWSLVGSLSTPPEIAADNAVMLADAVQTNLLTFLLGRTLPTASWLITGIMLLAAVSVAGRWWVQRRRGALTAAQWAEVLLAVFVALTAIWFALLSVGWPRYAHIGLMVALLLLGKTVWDGWQRLSPRINMPDAALVLALAVLALAVNLYSALNYQAPDGAQDAAAYIDANIPSEAVIETWEWQLDALTQHWAYHHPHQRYLFEAIRQFSHERQPFDLDYELLQADPDYLIVGTFGKWTRIYNPQDIGSSFVLIAEIGDYLIYERLRD